MPTFEERKAGLFTRFRDLVRPPAPAVAEEQAPEKHEPTAEEKLAAIVGPWLKAAPAAWWVELAKMERDAHTASRESISDHAKVAYALGYGDAIARLTAQCKKWRGQPAKADPQGE